MRPKSGRELARGVGEEEILCLAHDSNQIPIRGRVIMGAGVHLTQIRQQQEEERWWAVGWADENWRY